MINLDKGLDYQSRYDKMLIKNQLTQARLHGLFKQYYNAKAGKYLNPNTLNQMGCDINKTIKDHNDEVRKEVPYAKELFLKIIFFYGT